MGADIAAGPHCPVAVERQAWRGETAASGGFEACRASSRGLIGRHPSGSFRSLRSIRVPRGLPVRAEALAVRRAANERSEDRSLPPSHRPCRSAGDAAGGGPGRSPRSAFRTRDQGPSSGRCRSGRSPLPHPDGASGTGGSLRSVRPSAGRAAGRSWALHEACRPHSLGQALRVRNTAASSAAPPFASPPPRLVGPAASSPGPWPGRLSTFRSIVCATNRRLSWTPSRAKRIPPVDNKDNGNKSAARADRSAALQRCPAI